MIERTTTVNALIKTLNMMPTDKTAMICGQLFAQLGAKVQSHDDAIYGGIFKDAVGNLHFAAIELEAMRSLFKSNGYVTKKQLYVSCAASAIISVICGAFAFFAAVVYCG